MTSTRTRWMTAAGLTLGLLALGGCRSGVDLSKLPPIVIAVPAPTPAPEPAPEPFPRPRATLAFEVVDAHDGRALHGVFVRFESGLQLETNADGYAAMELEHGTYAVTFEGDGYVPLARQVQLDRNRQDTIRLTPVKAPEPPPAPKPPDPPVVVVPPVVTPPPVTPTPLCEYRVSAPLECVRQTAAKYPHLLQVNTYESCLEFTQRVLEVLGPDWGHVAKTAGESQSVPVGFEPVVVNGHRITGVSHDAIKHRVTGQVVDLLGNASANSDPDPKIHGPASTQWTLIPAQYWRENNPFVPAVPVKERR